jgi:hypothetical protein
VSEWNRETPEASDVDYDPWDDTLDCGCCECCGCDCYDREDYEDEGEADE